MPSNAVKKVVGLHLPRSEAATQPGENGIGGVQYDSRGVRGTPPLEVVA